MKIKKEKLIAGIATALLFGSIIGSMILFRSNTRLNDGLNDEKLKSEALMHEKVTLTKEIDKLKKDLTLLMATNKDNEKTIGDLRSKIQAKDDRIAQLNKESNSVKDLKKQVSELQQIRTDLEKQVHSLMAENMNLRQGNEAMENMLFVLRAENATLSQELTNAKLAAGDKFMVQSLKGKRNEKLTINAGKTRKLAVSFDLPKDVMADLKFEVITPSGRKVSEGNPELSWMVPGDMQILTASLDGSVSDIRVTRRVEMTYQPKERMEKGVYTIKIFNADSYVGSCQVKLR